MINHQPETNLHEAIEQGKVWRDARKDPPAEGVEVVCVSKGGLQYRMRRRGSLYLFADPGGLDYPYWTPILWRPMK